MSETDSIPSVANGKACCILGLPCCIPPGGLTQEGARKLALAKTMQKICSSLSDSDALEIADGLLTEFDLVPAGVGKAIAASYMRWIKGSVSQTATLSPNARR